MVLGSKARPALIVPLALVCIVILARVLTLALIPFDGLYGQDAYAYFDYAGVLRASLEAGREVPAFFWPAGYPLHVVAASWVLGMTPLAGQATSVLAGALAALFTYALAREARPDARGGALLAGLVVALAAQATISSLSVMADAVALAWATASAWLVLRYARTFEPWALPLAALALAVAVVTRWGFALLALPWSACVLVAWRVHWRDAGGRRVLVLGALAGALGGAVVGWQLLSGSHTGDLQVYGWDPLNAFRRDLVNPDGTFHYALPMALFYAEPLVYPSYVFPLLLPFWIAGLWWLLRRARAAARVLLLAWPLVVYVFLAGVTWQNPRVGLSYFPPLAVWCGLGFAWLWEARPAWRRGAALLAAVALMATFAWSLRSTAEFVARNKQEPLAAVRYAAAQVPARSVVFTFALTHTMRHYTDFRAFDLFEQTPDAMQALVCGAGPAFVYADVDNLEAQWLGRAPDENYRWLRDNTRFEAVGRYGAYSLFRLAPGDLRCAPPPRGPMCPGSRCENY